MTICKYFQSGNCRFGQSCRFDHDFNPKYSYQAHQPQGKPQYVEQISADVLAAIRGGQWLISAYGPFRDKPPFPGFTDYSPEEIRLCVYEANATSQLDGAIKYVNELKQQSLHRFEKLVEPNDVILRVLETIHKGEQATDPFQSSNFISTNVTGNSIFGSNNVFVSPAMPNQSQNLFGSSQSTNIFAQANAAVQPTSNIFAMANSAFAPQNNIFLSQTHPSPQTTTPFVHNTGFEQSNFQTPFRQTLSAHTDSNQFQTQAPVFGTSPVTSDVNTQISNIFATASKQIFGATGDSVSNTNTSPFQQPMVALDFTSEVSSPKPGNIFTDPNMRQNLFVNNQTEVMVPLNHNENNSIHYSKVEELSEEDLNAFRSDSFIMGKIPEVAPPRELCF